MKVFQIERWAGSLMRVAVPVVGLLVFAWASAPVRAQEEEVARSAQEVADIRAAYELATKEVEAMRERLAVQEKRLAEMNAQARMEAAQGDRRYQELESNYFDVRNVLENFRRTEAGNMAKKDAVNQRMVEIKDLLNAVSMKQEELKARTGVRSWQLEASRTLVNRLAEAQIDNRLNLLEADARVAAVQELIEESREGKMFQQEIESAKRLIENREVSLQLLKKKMANLKAESDERIAVEMQYRDAELAFREARSNLMNVSEQAKAGDPALHALLAEASLDLAVSQKLSRALAEEEERVSSVIDTAEAMSGLLRQRAALEDELAELQRMQGENKIRSETETRQRTVMAETLHERLIGLQVEMEHLKKQFGKNHPSTRSLESQIITLERYLGDLTKATDKE